MRGNAAARRRKRPAQSRARKPAKGRARSSARSAARASDAPRRSERTAAAPTASPAHHVPPVLRRSVAARRQRAALAARRSAQSAGHVGARAASSTATSSSRQFPERRPAEGGRDRGARAVAGRSRATVANALSSIGPTWMRARRPGVDVQARQPQRARPARRSRSIAAVIPHSGRVPGSSNKAPHCRKAGVPYRSASAAAASRYGSTRSRCDRARSANASRRLGNRPTASSSSRTTSRMSARRARIQRAAAFRAAPGFLQERRDGDDDPAEITRTPASAERLERSPCRLSAAPRSTADAAVMPRGSGFVSGPNPTRTSPETWRTVSQPCSATVVSVRSTFGSMYTHSRRWQQDPQGAEPPGQNPAGAQLEHHYRRVASNGERRRRRH